MKKIISICLFLTFAWIQGGAQTANPYIFISVPFGIPQCSTIFLDVRAGNSGNGNIVAHSMEVFIKVGNNAEIVGVHSSSDPRWNTFLLVPGPGGEIRLRNTGTFGFMDEGRIFIILKALAPGGP